MRRTFTLLLVLIGLVPSGHPIAAGPALLTNGRIRAEFGERGLAGFTDLASQMSYRIDDDDFGLTVGSETFDSHTLPAPTRAVEKDRVVYTWTAGAYRITVAYDLASGWRFVSKQISVVAAPANTFHVSEVVVFRESLADPIVDSYVPKSARPSLGTGDYGACLRLDKTRSLLVTVQNPFLTFTGKAESFSLAYKPDLDWNLADGPFVADRGLLAPVQLTGRRVPDRMVPEWQLAPPAPATLPPPSRPAAADASVPQAGMDQAEVEAFTELVRAFLLAKPAKPVNVLVGWCLNDYQIDVATPEGRAEYRRIFDQAAAVGANYVLYAPSNSDLSRREQSIDDWSWEHVLWLNLGQKIRANEWNPRTDPVPASVQEMLDAARAKDLKLLAYVYPVLPFSQNPAWLVPIKNDPNRKRANLGFRTLQDFLIETLVTFHDRLGLGGYAFDHTFLNYEGTSRYAQWAGWRRVMEELRRRIPDIVIDGRQAYHLYGPWSWLAGSYPHPTFSDEQPESFVPFPDLHFDRVSADRERYTAYRYRNYEFAPSEIVPGFMTHQTSRGDDTGEMPEKKTDKGVMLLPFRVRDWDSLGFRYSVLSSIAVGGWNNVIDMIPARDLEENRAFTQEGEADRAWFRKWIDWTATNKEYLRHTRTILGQPQLGKIDGTSAIVGDNGFVFLFNPNARRLTVDLPLDESLGVPRERRFQVRELEPVEGRAIGKPGSGVWASGDRVPLTLDGGTALVLQLQPVRGPATVATLFNVPGTVTVENGVVNVVGAKGEIGTEQQVQVLLPAVQPVTAMRVNGENVPFAQAGQLVSAKAQFGDGPPFRRYQQVADYDPSFEGGRLTTNFTVPQRVFDQLTLRQKTWPIGWTAEDYRTTWLAPDRLLLFVQIAEPDPKWEARMWIDGRPVELRKAYSAIRTTAPRTFVGFYADITLVEADRRHLLELQLPSLKRGQLQGIFFENVETAYTDRLAVRATGRMP